MSTNCARHAKQRERPLPPPSIACLEVVRWADMRSKIKTAPPPPLAPSLRTTNDDALSWEKKCRCCCGGSVPEVHRVLRHSMVEDNHNVLFFLASIISILPFSSSFLLENSTSLPENSFILPPRILLCWGSFIFCARFPPREARPFTRKN